MKWNCELIQDLLPLYEEELCSPASRDAVREHLCECDTCRLLAAPLPIAQPEEPPAADRAVKKSMRKVRRRWLLSLVAAVLAVPLLLLGVNQYRGQGLCFTNPDDFYTAWRFLHALETQDWETAAKMHDYSISYNSILDALEMDVEEWGIRFTPFQLSGYDYAAKTPLARDDAIPQTPQELYGFLYNRTGTAMVPLAVWEELMTVDPDAFYQEGWQYWLNGERYGKITTEWGDFVVSDGQSYNTAYDYAHYFDLIPASIYEEVKPAMAEEAQRLYNVTHQEVGWVAELTETEFEQEMIHRYTADLEALEGNVTFNCTGYRSAHRYTPVEDGWCIIFDVTITQGSRTLDTQIDLPVQDGKIIVASISHQPGATWLDAIDRALYPSAHPGY